MIRIYHDLDSICMGTRISDTTSSISLHSIRQDIHQSILHSKSSNSTDSSYIWCWINMFCKGLHMQDKILTMERDM